MPEKQRLLHVNTCGGEGGGKSTLMARLVSESKPGFDPEQAVLELDSGTVGIRPRELDFARLLSGSEAGQQQGAEQLGVVHGFFCTEQRSFLVADPPGNQDFTRSLLLAASTADFSILVVDASQGVLEETRRHAVLVRLLGVEQIVLAINKMDLVGFSEAGFARIRDDFRHFAAQTQLSAVSFIPISSRQGDNIAERSMAMPWYQGPTLMDLIDQLEIDQERSVRAPFRMSVQEVRRLDSGWRSFAGSVLAGRVKTGDEVRIQPSGRVSRVARIAAPDGDLEQARVGQSITLRLQEDLDAARGDLIVAADKPTEVADQFEATLIWISASPLLPGRSYLLKTGAQTLTASVAPLKYKINVDNLERIAAVKLERSEIGVCNLRLDRVIAFEPYRDNRDTGGFVLLDSFSKAVVAAGLLHFALRRANNVHWQAIDVNKAARSALKAQKPCVLWYTGLSGAGKSAIANLVDKKLHALNRHAYLLDGDNVRHGLNKDLGFTDADRVENIRRIAEVAKLMADAGLIVLAAFISPFRAERRMARALLPPGEFIEIFVDAPLALAEQRDPKGLYKKARRGELKNFTGIDSPYEVPENPELRIDTSVTSVEVGADMVIEFMQAKGWLDAG